MLSDVCLSGTLGLSREQRGLGRLKLAHVTRDSDNSFKVKRSRSPGRFTHRRVSASASVSCSGCQLDRGKVLTVGTEDADSLLLRCALQGWRHSVAAPLQAVQPVIIIVLRKFTT